MLTIDYLEVEFWTPVLHVMGSILLEVLYWARKNI